MTPIIIFVIWLAVGLDKEIKNRLEQGWFSPPVEIYTRPPQLEKGLGILPSQVEEWLLDRQYRKRSDDKPLRAHNFSWWPVQKCMEPINPSSTILAKSCLLYRNEQNQLHMILWDQQDRILHLFENEPLVEKDQLLLPAQLFAQYYGDSPMLRTIVPISQVPLSCLQAATAIEDAHFLEHRGVSFLGLARAVAVNLLKGRLAQGGSTITQQLVKNYFLTSERTFKRKFVEMIMSFLLENRVSKDKILESYLNVIYMGQNGPFQVRGFAAASEHYFNKPLEDLNLSECAMLAAIINSPGRYDPHRNPEAALNRRNKVLNDMARNNMIEDDVLKSALELPLPTKPPRTYKDPAPYYIDAVLKELTSLKIDSENGLKIFTNLDLQAQSYAQQAIARHLKDLEKWHKPTIEQLQQNKQLQSLLISADIRTGQIIALVGGRNYRLSQYNRAIESHRQVGSIMKPFSYLAALETIDSDGNPYTPLTMIDDDKFVYQYEGQSWEPHNYSNTYLGSIPMFYALKNSINVPTAKLGLAVGLDSVIGVARRTGLSSNLEPFPSLTLGAFELHPFEVMQAYTTIARMGNFTRIQLIDHITDLKENLVYQPKSEQQQVVASENVAVLIGMLKQTVLSGTAQSLKGLGFLRPAAGKTGTTSTGKDAWFVGFTPYNLTLVWVGYDDNTPTGLTGASGAVPIWGYYMLNYTRPFPYLEFNWPEGTEVRNLSSDELQKILPTDIPAAQTSTQLIFKKGTP